MLSENLLALAVKQGTKKYFKIKRTKEMFVPAPTAGKDYMLYMHIPFCEKLCPYCSFHRFIFCAEHAEPYFKSLRAEMLLLKERGYDFESLYVGGGTPTVMIDELCETIDLARNLFSITEVSSETNPNHLTPEYLDKLKGRVQRLSVGVQSFNDDLLKQMDRFEKYGSGKEIFERIKYANTLFPVLNVDMIFNFPAQTEELLKNDLEMIIESGASQTTFYPLMVSPAVELSLRESVGKVDYAREQNFYQIICDTLAEKTSETEPCFRYGSAWTFNRQQQNTIDEYVVDYEEYPAIGSGGITYLEDSLYVNTFSLKDYHKAIGQGRMSLMGKARFSRVDRMRYRFMMQLFGLRLDKEQFKADFGRSVERALPFEMAFMRLAGAFATDDNQELTLTAKGRYLMVVMMRQFFIGVNTLRDQARNALDDDEQQLLFG
ncbi:MAG: coproporphyrinogen III oxidase family protein [Eggerthellaceae bacterium]|jgi:coproporphyrinogen III oxidase-like Fe-S oxidoreductase|nr:coproporphyrinogen III oxidase family protein [Eggerthellaceae bacterium]